MMGIRFVCLLACAAVGALASSGIIPAASLARVNDLTGGAARMAAAADVGLPEVWAQLNISAATAAQLLSSPDVRVASMGLLYYTCAGSGAPHNHDAATASVSLPAAPAGRFAQTSAVGAAAAALAVDDPFALPFPPPAQAFKLHSNPGAKSAIYLDFTGCDLRGSWWEGTTNNRAFALARVNANATRSEDSFTDEERQLIVASWRTTAEVYRAWDVDVTTEDTTNNTAITTQVVCIGGSVEDWAVPTKQASGQVVGLCWVNTFGNRRGPCMVWTESNYFVRDGLRQTIAHEVGHALGLSHSINGIMTGIGSAGVDSILRFTDDAGTGQPKDQLATIGTKLPLVSANIGSNTTNATLLCSAPSLFGFKTTCTTGQDSITTAVVETVMASAVPHVYRFDAPAAARVREVLVEVTPTYLWPGGHPGGITTSSMDTLLEILGPDQLVPLSPTPASNNPEENIIGGQGAALRDILLPRAGTYFIRVSSAKYAALGSYKLAATLPVADTPTGVPPLANPDTATVEATRSVVVPVLANDVDRSGITGRLVLASVEPPAQGVAIITGQQNITYTAPAGFQGQVTVTYTVQDRWGLTSSGTLTITVVPFNIRPPVARDDFMNGNACAFGSFMMQAGQQRVVDVLANDVDPDNTTLAIKDVGLVRDSFGRDTLGAKAEISDDGTKILFTSNAPLPGTNEPRALLFTYTIVNSAELTATATVCVSTQWAADTSGYRPVARADNFTVIALQENTLQVLTNDDTPPGSGPLRVVNVTEDTVLRLAPSIADGGDAIVYFPMFSSGDVQPWPAKDVFEYTVINAWGYTATGSINVTVIEYGELPPLVSDLTDPVGLIEGGSTTYDARKLIKSRSNATVRVIRWGPAEPPVGRPFVDVLENYYLMFTADTNYTGWVRVPYTVLDSNGFQATGYINIPLNNPGPLPGPPPPPLLAAPPPPPSTGGPLAATDDIAACQLRHTVDIPVLANDGGSRVVRVVAVSKPAVGRAAVAPGGRSVRYLAPRGGLPASKRVVRFSYTVKDDTSGTTGAASVTVVLTQPGQAPCRRLTLPCVSPSGALSLSCAGAEHCMEHRGYACRYTYRPSGTTCRAAYAPCDVPEYCTGSSAACPRDARAPDGTGCSGRRPYTLYTITYGRSSATGAVNSTAATSAHVAPNFAADAASFTAPDLAAGVSAADPQDVGVQGGRKIYTPKCGVCKAGRCQAVPASSGTYTCVAAG